MGLKFFFLEPFINIRQKTCLIDDVYSSSPCRGQLKNIWHFLLVIDRIVVVGNHHDAWVMGAVDPSSGSAVLMEVVRAVGLAVKKGNF